MTNNFEKDINDPSKEIIIEFSDGYCIVLENNEISMRDNVFTKLQIMFGKRTNELLEFVKGLYLNKKAKEQECDKYKQALDEIEKVFEGYYPNGILKIPQSQTELTINLLGICEAKLRKISNIIQKTKYN